MAIYCSVPECKNSNYKKSNLKISFHHFPKNNEKLLLKWKKFCDREKDSKLKSGNICSEHFIEEDYEILKISLEGNFQLLRRLKKNVFPTLRNKPMKQIVLNNQRNIKRQNEKLITDLLENPINNRGHNSTENKNDYDYKFELEKSKIEIINLKKTIAILKDDIKLRDMQINNFTIKISKLEEKAKNECLTVIQLDEIQIKDEIESD